jgi:hypothetical protein
MACYTHIDTSSRFLAVDLQRQLLKVVLFRKTAKNGVRHNYLMDREAKAGLRFSKSRRWRDGAKLLIHIRK